MCSPTRQVVQLTLGCEVARVGLSPSVSRSHRSCIAPPAGPADADASGSSEFVVISMRACRSRPLPSPLESACRPHPKWSVPLRRRFPASAMHTPPHRQDPHGSSLERLGCVMNALGLGRLSNLDPNPPGRRFPRCRRRAEGQGRWGPGPCHRMALRARDQLSPGSLRPTAQRNGSSRHA